MTNIFEQASRINLHFTTSRGVVPVSDLWDMKMTSTNGNFNLNSLYTTINRELKESQEEGLLTSKTKETTLNQLRLDIIKHIFDVKQEEAEAQSKAVANKERKQYLLSLKASAQQEKDKELSMEDIDKELEALS